MSNNRTKITSKIRTWENFAKQIPKKTKLEKN